MVPSSILLRMRNAVPLWRASLSIMKKQQPIEKKEKKSGDRFASSVRAHFAKQPFSIHLGRVVGLAAAGAFTILAYAAGLATGGLLWGIFTAVIASLLVSPMFYESTSRAFNTMFNKDSEKHIIQHLESSPTGWLKTIIIILGMLLFTVAAAAMGALGYSAALSLGLPFFACVALPICLALSIWTTMTAGWATLWTTTGKQLKAFFKKIFCFNEKAVSVGAVTRYLFRLAVVLSCITGACYLAFLSALGPLSLMHQAGIGILSMLHIKTIININLLTNVLIYGITFGTRILFAAISSAGSFVNAAHRFCDAFFNLGDTLKSLGRSLVKSFSSPLELLKLIIVKPILLVLNINSAFGGILTLFPSPRVNMIAAVNTAASPPANGSSLNGLSRIITNADATKKDNNIEQANNASFNRVVSRRGTKATRGKHSQTIVLRGSPPTSVAP